MSNNFPSFKCEPFYSLEQRLSPVPSCSKYNVLNSDFDSNRNNDLNICMNKDKLVENKTRLHEGENVLSNYSNHRYDENNNCILTNFNDYGLRFFDSNEENNIDTASSEKYLYDNSSNNFNYCFDTCTEVRNLQNGYSDYSNCNEINNLIGQNNISYNKGISSNSKIQNNELIPNFKVELQNNSKEDTKKYVCNNELETDFEQILKCNLIAQEDWKDTIDRELEDSKVEEIICDSESEHCVIEVSSGEEILDKGDEVNILHKTDDSDTLSYHSSDFEFIDELEATKDLPISLNVTFQNNESSNNVEIDKFTELDEDNIIYEYFNNARSDVTKSNVVPTGNDLNNLFLWSCVPYPCRNMENKAVQSMRGMKVCDSTGFDMQFLHLQNDPGDNYKEEAYESAKIIVSMYPNENRGRRPQRHIN